MQIINTHEAKTHLSKLLDAVSKGQEIIIGRANTPIAKLVPYDRPAKKRAGGQLTGQIKMADDFDVLPDDFMNYFSRADDDISA